MSNRRSHSGRMQGTDPAKPLGNLEAELFIETFDDVVLDILAAMAGKTVNTVTITNSFQRVHHKNDRFLLYVDNSSMAPLRLRARRCLIRTSADGFSGGAAHI